MRTIENIIAVITLRIVRAMCKRGWAGSSDILLKYICKRCNIVCTVVKPVIHRRAL